MKLAESRERIIQLESRLKQLEDKDETVSLKKYQIYCSLCHMPSLSNLMIVLGNQSTIIRELLKYDLKAS